MTELDKLGEQLLDPAFIKLAQRQFAKSHPGFQELGIEVVSIGEGRASMRLPYDPKFIGDRNSGSLHGGIITTLMDTLCGLCVMATLRTPTPIATLDLRMDYLRPTRRGLDIIAEAECYSRTKSVAFVRGFALQGDEREPVAHCNASFMLNTKGANFPTSNFSSIHTDAEAGHG
ncbi:MAG: PaaI family thioesterase [Pseudomonadales bacterium]|jgi:uncharacterized protein (TIGR00369 family)|nr:PaaI family thioesterase [Pseudomonadales bacterium]MCC6530506.1 PaaI family thioesterase [Pseudomonadales bacterium]MCP5333130.1 PaaI family thioesterase [Pseudomonadales bacterium]HMU89807.1 PaaI family thioesterase [Pseudomonadales bacterium]HMW14357.1 PaaI family thioesterase [Pseudomonadales bacterium]